MLGSVIGKVIWIGRARVFLFGLTVVLAILFGAASTALGANGNSLILRKAGNTASKGSQPGHAAQPQRRLLV